VGQIGLFMPAATAELLAPRLIDDATADAVTGTLPPQHRAMVSESQTPKY
jgi:hypothetical protein